MKLAVKDLKNLLDNGTVLITYKKLNEDISFEKYFSKSGENFCCEETNTLRLISVAEEKEETLHESQILGFRTFNRGHDKKRIKTPEAIKEEFQKFQTLAKNFLNFDEIYFDPTTDLQKLKVCVLLELQSFEEFEDESQEALDKLKAFWKRQIEAHKRQTINHVNTELINNSVFDDEVINEIKEMIINYDSTEDLSQINSKRDLFEFWPTILLPAPDFINEIFVDLFRFSDR
jgi:hypothetical protein